MTPQSLPFPPDGPRSDLDLVEYAWLTAWRMFWLDLPLAWAGEMDRFLFRWIEKPGTGVDTAGPPTSDVPHTSAEAVALGLGCGDFSGEALV